MSYVALHDGAHNPIGDRHFSLWRQAWRVRAFHAASYRATWQGSVISSFVAPVLYLLALGFGLQDLVNDGAGINGVPYVAFVVPGILASQVMQLAVFESTYPVMAGFRWTRFYIGMHAAPLSPAAIYLGHLLFLIFRMLLMSVGFVVVALAMGAISGWVVWTAIPIAILGGLAHAAVLTAMTSFVKDEGIFNVVNRMIVLPMFLFAGTFYPVSVLQPEWLQTVAWSLPLTHAIAAAREAMLGTGEWLLVLGHMSYVMVWLVAGVAVGIYGFARRLQKEA